MEYILPLVAAMLAIAFGCFTLKNNKRKKSTFTDSTQAEVLYYLTDDYFDQAGASSKIYYPVLKYSVNDNEHVICSSDWYQRKKWRQGSYISINYDPENTDKFSIKESVGGFLTPLLAFLVAAFFLFMELLVLTGNV